MMDRALKERIIGAVVLVLVVVLVVPVFLDGPPSEEEIVSTSVPLPGQSEQKTQTVVLDRDRDAPVPSTTAEKPRPESQPESQPEPQPEPQRVSRTEVKEPEVAREKPAPDPVPERQPPAAETEAPAATVSATGMWAVQLGSFGNQENAERLAADLRSQGYAAFLSKLATNSGELHRVRVGPQKDRESAEAMAERLQKAGHTGQVVPHP